MGTNRDYGDFDKSGTVDNDDLNVLINDWTSYTIRDLNNVLSYWNQDITKFIPPDIEVKLILRDATDEEKQELEEDRIRRVIYILTLEFEVPDGITYECQNVSYYFPNEFVQIFADKNNILGENTVNFVQPTSGTIELKSNLIALLKFSLISNDKTKTVIDDGKKYIFVIKTTSGIDPCEFDITRIETNHNTNGIGHSPPSGLQLSNEIKKIENGQETDITDQEYLNLNVKTRIIINVSCPT